MMETINALVKQLNKLVKTTWVNPETKSEIRIHHFSDSVLDDDGRSGFYITHHSGGDCDWDDNLTLTELIVYLVRHQYHLKIRKR
jgi:hypothetical protein